LGDIFKVFLFPSLSISLCKPVYSHLNGQLNALENGKGKKLGLWKKLGQQYADSDGTSAEIDSLFETGKMEHILAAIDKIVGGEVNLPPGDQTKLF